jgi:hypothetical protein
VCLFSTSKVKIFLSYLTLIITRKPLFYYFSDETEYDQGGIDIPDGKKAITINDDILTIDDDIVIL